MNKRKAAITAGVILGVATIVILLGGIVLGNYIEDKLQDRQAGTYRIQSRQANVNVFLRRISVHNAIIKDTAANQQFTVPEIRATGIHIFPFVFNDELIINKLVVTQPEIKVEQGSNKEDTAKQEHTFPEQDRKVEWICIKQFEVSDASVYYLNQVSGATDTILSFHSGLEIRNLNLFRDNQVLKLNGHSAENLEVNLSNACYDLPGGLYSLQFRSLSFNAKQEALRLENLHLSSLYSKYEIAGQTGAETDWYDIILEKLNIEGINMRTLLQDSAIVFETAELDGLDATIFRDKRPQFPEKPDTKLPMEMLQALPVPVYTDSLLIKNGNVVYEEHGEESSGPGKITFGRLYATIYNLGTLHDSIDGQTAMAVRALVMNEALLKAEFVFPNKKHSHQYRVSGSMEPVRLSIFNPMLVPSAFVRIEQGRLKQLKFDFTYDNNNSEGTLAMQYENLEVVLLDKEDGSKKTIKTFITETFVLQEDNLKKENSYQKGTISFEREKNKSIFNYWWKSLFSGIKDILAF